MPANRHEWLLAWHNAPHAHQTPAEQACIVAFALYADPDTGGSVRPAQATIATKVGLSVTTVGRAIRQAVLDGWFIEVTSGRGRSMTSCYQLASPLRSVDEMRPLVNASARETSDSWHRREMAGLDAGRILRG
jgi:biotin operon repressor